MSANSVDVAIVGAGPYGLSLAAHLRAAGVPLRIFGRPMGFWREHMPRGMLLKSEAGASSLSDPRQRHTLSAFCRATTRSYADRGTPVPLSTFVEYGEWFQHALVPEVEPVDVIDVAREGRGFRIRLADGDVAHAHTVAVATGVQHFAYTPRVLSQLPQRVVSHSSAHADLAVFGGRDVLIVGAGQSALECAALLAEHGARARIVARGPRLVWNGEPFPDVRGLAWRLREPRAPLGSGWATWFYSNHPALFRHLPQRERIRRARTALGPAGAWWLRPRIEGRCEVLLGHAPVDAEPFGRRVRVRARTIDGTLVDLVADHVIAATGYRPDLSRLGFLHASRLGHIQTCFGAPKVNMDFESSVPGLFFVGPIVAATFGPAMRFVWGAEFAARTVAQRIASSSVRRKTASLV